jgi:ABC-2 type transport system ATP-binding protein
MPIISPDRRYQRAARGAAAAQDPAIQAEELAKMYPGGSVALGGVSLAVGRGEVFGLLGPNGSGKTTMVRIFVTLLAATSGTARVGGFDVRRQPGRVRELIGYAGQFTGIDDDLTGAENLALQGMLHGLAHGEAWARAGEVLDAFSLAGAAGTRAGRLSGGLRRRLDVAQALLHRPAVLFLDEPTTGLDPASRAETWDQVRELSRSEGMTVFLTTQYLEEADRVCDRVAIIDGGQLITAGTPASLKAEVGGGRIAVVLAEAGPWALTRARAVLEACPQVTKAEPGDPLVIHVQDARASVAPVVRCLDEAGVEVRSMEQAEVSLDDVFLHYTGQVPRDEAPVAGAVSGIFATAHGRRRR